MYDLARFVTFLEDGNAVGAAGCAANGDAEPADGHAARARRSRGVRVRAVRRQGLLLPDGYHATTLVSHGGDIPGFAADVYYVPSTKFAIIVLANTDGAHFTNSVVLALETYAGLPAPTTAPSFPIDPSTFASLAGSYQDDFNAGRVIITTPTTP